MRTIPTTIKIFLLSFLVHQSLLAQEVNWRSIKKDNSQHLVAASFGGDYNFYYGASYGHIISNRVIPAVIGTEISLPFGNNILDDWRWRTSVQAELWHRKHLSLSVKTSFILRRYESALSRMYNTGADISLLLGHLKPKWGLVALVNYDASIATHIQHDLAKELYPRIRDGWYGSTGGNVKLGTRGHLAVNSWQSFLTVGKHFGKNFKDNPTFPFFVELSLQRPLRK